MTAAAQRPPWFDPAVPGREDCVLKYMLDARAARHGSRRVALFEDGSSWTYAECREQVRRAAAALQSLGVGKGDRVIVWLPTGRPQVLGWFAANYLGAIFVPLNTAYRGRVLEHVINSARAAVMIVHHGLLDRLAGLSLPALRRLIVVGGPATLVGALEVHGEPVLDADPSSLDDTAAVDHWDTQSIIYTSGTTGLSKGVLSPYLQLYTTAVVNYGYMRDGESILVNLPMFHVGGTSPTYCALVRTGSFYLVDGFSTTRFWDQVREGGCVSTSGLIGVMAPFLAKPDPRPDDRDHPLRCLTLAPVNAQTIALAGRFGFDYLTGFNMTEVSTPLLADLNAGTTAGCGRPRSGIECRLVDANDIEVPRGAIGELIVRADVPWSMNAGYDGLPEATAAAWRNGWFHTGDLMRQDESGTFHFVDRRKDAIRRRGENISSFEVEAAVKSHPDVDEVVAVAVPSEIEEEEVLVAVSPKPGRTIDPRALVEFLVPTMPYFMVPRYVRIVAQIPKTETNKPRKVVFREQGVTVDTWDREKAGLSLRRERL
jgi:crotonobetaine/carnitine-CoA ligase